MDIVGQRFKSKNFGWFTIKEYFSFSKVLIEFDSGYSKFTTLKEVKTGSIKDVTVPTVFGIGFYGVGEHKARVNYKNTKCYDSWRGMLRRCYSEESLKKRPTYKGCYVDSKWLNYQNFANWYYDNLITENQRVDLDKDILIKGNKVYSETTCCLVPTEVNALFSGASKLHRGKYPIGVYFKKDIRKYRAQLHRGDTSQDCLGDFNSKEEAFNAYKVAKEIHVKDVAKKYRDKITNECYSALMNYEVSIDD